MRRLLALLPIVALALVVRPASGEEPTTYTLPKREAWKAGDVVSRTESKHQVQKTIIKGPDGTVNEQASKAQDELVELTVVMKVAEVNGEGEFTKALLYFSKWSRKEADAEDTSLAGKHVEITGAGKAREAKILGGGEVSEKAAKWLKAEFAKGDKEAGGEAFAPDRPLAVGETWTPDAAAIEKMFGGDGQMKFVHEQSTVTGTLVAVEGDLATLHIDIDLQAGPMEGPMGPMEWQEGGKFSMKVDGKKALTATNHNETGRMTGTFKGTMAPGPVTVEIDLTIDNSMETTSGGEMPPLPGTK